MTDQTQTTDLPDGMGVMNNMDQLAFLIGQWFENGHKDLKHAYDVPEGTPVTITFEKDGQPEQLVMTGDMLKGFKAGIIVAANVFGQLPFARVAQPEDGQPANDEPASGN